MRHHLPSARTNETSPEAPSPRRRSAGDTAGSSRCPCRKVSVSMTTKAAQGRRHDGAYTAQHDRWMISGDRGAQTRAEECPLFSHGRRTETRLRRPRRPHPRPHPDGWRRELRKMSIVSYQNLVNHQFLVLSVTKSHAPESRFSCAPNILIRSPTKA